MFSEIAKGDSAAEEFLKSFYLWVHNVDDGIDRDKPANAAETAVIHTNLFFVLSKNAFFSKNSATLLPVVLTSALAYVASEERKNSADVLDRITAQVLKSEYINVFFMVAYIIGGWDHALEMSRKWRAYDFDAEPVKDK